MWHEAYMGGFMGVGWIIPILIFALIIYLIVGNKNQKSPKDILDERFAKGEISKKEYEEALKVLKD